LANLLQSSRSTFSWGSFPSFFAFKAGILDTQISAPGGWPTVSARLLDRRELSFSKEPFSSDESFPQSMRCSQQFMRDEILYFAYIYDDSTSR
jgi:hypothetical protein